VRIGRQVERQFEWDDDGLSPLSGGLSEASYSINERPTVLGQTIGSHRVTRRQPVEQKMR